MRTVLSLELPAQWLEEEGLEKLRNNVRYNKINITFLREC